MTISGKLFIGDTRVEGRDTFHAISPVTGEALEPAFQAADRQAVDRACALAWAAFDAFRELDVEARAAFLEAIAEQILTLGDELLERAMLESGLPLARLTGERGRTLGQLRLFADELRSGGWMGVRVDPALPERKPLPRSDLRQRQVALGPVVVFGASNFPLAFSVAGGDTALALAAGCPVIVKGHPAHPGTSELVAHAIVTAARACQLPPGVFSLLNGNSNELGAALVGHPLVKAVGFTGSRAGGLLKGQVGGSWEGTYSPFRTSRLFGPGACARLRYTVCQVRRMTFESCCKKLEREPAGQWCRCAQWRCFSPAAPA